MQASNTAAQWRTDEELCKQVGDWWLEEMELHNDANMQQNVTHANAELQERGRTERVQDCREAADECGLEWLM